MAVDLSRAAQNLRQLFSVVFWAALLVSATLYLSALTFGIVYSVWQVDVILDRQAEHDKTVELEMARMVRIVQDLEKSVKAKLKDHSKQTKNGVRE